MKKIKLTITAIVTDKAYDYDIEELLDEQNVPAKALALADKFDNKYAEIIGADVEVKTVKAVEE